MPAEIRLIVTPVVQSDTLTPVERGMQRVERVRVQDAVGVDERDPLRACLARTPVARGGIERRAT